MFGLYDARRERHPYRRHRQGQQTELPQAARDGAPRNSHSPEDVPASSKIVRRRLRLRSPICSSARPTTLPALRCFRAMAMRSLAADCTFEIRTPIKLAKKFGASVYASSHGNSRAPIRSACLVYILEPIEYVDGDGARALVRRIEPSPAFISNSVARLKRPSPRPRLGPVLPIGRKMTSPRAISITDLDGTNTNASPKPSTPPGTSLSCSTPCALTATTIILPPGFKKKVQTVGARPTRVRPSFRFKLG